MKNFILAISLFTVASTSYASALFDGKTIENSYYHPDLSTPTGSNGSGKYVVRTGVEIKGSTFYNVDYSDTSMYIDFLDNGQWRPDGEFNGFLTSDLKGEIDNFLELQMTLTTNMVGLSLDDLLVERDRFGFNWIGLAFTQDTFVRLDFERPSAVPVPAAIWLMGTGLLGLMGLSRKNKIQPVTGA